jgi:twitching motility two-component system response regulator PilH
MPKKILIIDDEPDMRLYLGTLFRKAGYQTAEAENGLQGVQQARSFKPDLITLDLLMPRRSGKKAYGELKASHDTRHIPVVVLTGVTHKESLFRDGHERLPRPEAVIEKPIEREAFLRTIGEILGE